MLPHIPDLGGLEEGLARGKAGRKVLVGCSQIAQAARDFARAEHLFHKARFTGRALRSHTRDFHTVHPKAEDHCNRLAQRQLNLQTIR